MFMRTLGLLTLLGLLAASLYYAHDVWNAVEVDQAMPAGIWLALGLGVLFSIVVGAGLMALVFYSSRHGYDDRASGGDNMR